MFTPGQIKGITLPLLVPVRVACSKAHDFANDVDANTGARDESVAATPGSWVRILPPMAFSFLCAFIDFAC